MYRKNSKSKTAAIILSFFFGPFAYLYTYKKNSSKFWICIGVSVITFSLAFWLTWLFSIIDMITAKDAFYKKITSKQKIVLWAIPTVGLIVVSSAIIAGIILVHQEDVKKERLEQARLARLQSDPITVPNLFKATNKLRHEDGVTAQSIREELTKSAEQKCSDMVNNDYFAWANPKTSKKAYDYVLDNQGSLFIGYYGAFVLSGNTLSQTATDIVSQTAQNNASISDPKFNIVGWATCDPKKEKSTVYAVMMYAEEKAPPPKTEVRYLPSPTPIYHPTTTHCYNDLLGSGITCSTY
jgi:hypothetical protein